MTANSAAPLRTVLLGLISLALGACSIVTPGSGGDPGITKDSILIGATVP